MRVASKTITPSTSPRNGARGRTAFRGPGELNFICAARMGGRPDYGVAVEYSMFVQEIVGLEWWLTSKRRSCAECRESPWLLF